MRKIVLGLLALLMTATAVFTAPRRASAQTTCPLHCLAGYHCCQTRNYVCLPNSTICP